MVKTKYITGLHLHSNISMNTKTFTMLVKVWHHLRDKDYISNWSYFGQPLTV